MAGYNTMGIITLGWVLKYGWVLYPTRLGIIPSDWNASVPYTAYGGDDGRSTKNLRHFKLAIPHLVLHIGPPINKRGNEREWRTAVLGAAAHLNCTQILHGDTHVAITLEQAEIFFTPRGISFPHGIKTSKPIPKMTGQWQEILETKSVRPLDKQDIAMSNYTTNVMKLD